LTGNIAPDPGDFTLRSDHATLALMGDKKPFDRIGYWSELKLEIIRKYAAAYSKIMSRQVAIRGYGYIDAFAGPGVHVSRRTGDLVAGSPLNALSIQPPFSEYHFVDINPEKAAHLRQLVSQYFPDRDSIWVHQGDSNVILPTHVFPRFRYTDYKRALCFLDPYRLDVDWGLLSAAGSSRSIELFMNCAIMDANRNVLWRRSDAVGEAARARLTRVWGNEDWRQVAYIEGPGLFGPEYSKASGSRIAEAFRARLREGAGFPHVSQPLPMRISTGAVLYYIYFATHNATAARIVESIFRKYG